MKLLTTAIKANTRHTSLRAKAARHSSVSPQPLAASKPGVASRTASAASERLTAPGHERVYLLRFFPNAAQVCIAGSFNGWDPAASPLKNCGKGRWVAGLLLKPGRYEYRFVVDGKWDDDVFAQIRVGNPFGGANCVLVVHPQRNAL